MSLPPKPWHPEARRMRAAGARIKDICQALGCKSTSLRQMLDESGAYAARRARRAAARETAPDFTRADHPILMRRPTRAPQPDRSGRAERIAAAARAFAAFEIDRAELSRRLREPA